jgi:RNA polymerase sigma factor (sigma-70 family)
LINTDQEPREKKNQRIEAELVMAYRAGDEHALVKLIRNIHSKNLAMYAIRVSRHGSRRRGSLGAPEDLIAMMYRIVWKLASDERYDPKRTSLSVMAWLYLRNAVQNQMKWDNRKKRQDIDGSFAHHCEWQGHERNRDKVNELEFACDLDRVSEEIQEPARTILQMLFDGWTVSQIAEQLRMSKTRVRVIIRKELRPAVNALLTQDKR